VTERADPAAPLPLVVLGGYLGAGKTTLLNHLLRHADGRRIAVLVNDFGAINIDAELIEGQDGQTLSLAGGCVCCTFGADLVGTLAGLAQRTPRPDIAVIELSGVALPAAVMRTARLAPGIAVQGCVVLADATDIGRLAADPYVGDTVRQQLADADLLLLTKTDLLGDHEAARGEAGHALSGLAPQARLIARPAVEVPVEVLLDWPVPTAVSGDEGVASAALWSVPRPMTHPGAASTASTLAFASASTLVPGRVDVEGLARALADPAAGVLRAKGLLQDADGQGQLLQLVGPRWQLTPAVVQAPGRLVTIGRAGQWTSSQLEHLVRQARVPAP